MNEAGRGMERPLNADMIRFVLPSHAFSFRFIKSSGYDVNNPYVGNKFIFRMFRELHFKTPLPGKSIWFNKANIVHSPVIFVYESLIIPEYIEWLQRKNENSKIILCYANPVRSRVSPLFFRNEWCEKWSSDPNDSVTYHMNWYNGGAYFKVHKVQKTAPRYDIFYVGKDKERLNKLLVLKNKFTELGLKTYFHVTAQRRYLIKRSKSYKPFMPYEKVLELLGQTKAILHLVDGGQTGVTLRVVEALVHRIKLVTDNPVLMEYDFYHPNNIFILGVDDMKNLPRFLKSPYQAVKSIFYGNEYFEDMIRVITGIAVEGK